MDLYAEHLLDHYRHPRLKHPLRDADIVHTERNPACGDTCTLQVKFAGERIEAVGWTGEGCAISQAAMSMLSESLPGKTVSALAALSAPDILRLLAVPISPRRLKCALLCLHTLHNTLHSRNGEPLQSWVKTVESAAEPR